MHVENGLLVVYNKSFAHIWPCLSAGNETFKKWIFFSFMWLVEKQFELVLQAELGQAILFSKHTSTIVVAMIDISIRPTLSCSPSYLLSNELNSTIIDPSWMKFGYLAMLFFSQLDFANIMSLDKAGLTNTE